MSTLRRVALTEREEHATCWAVNCYGVAHAKRATRSNLRTFSRKYVATCLREAIKWGERCRWMVPREALSAALEKIERERT